MANHRYMKKGILEAGLVSLALVGAGCTSNNEKDSGRFTSSTSSEINSEAEKGPIIGNKEDSGKKIEIVNRTNSELISLFIWPVGAELAEESIMGEGMSVKPDQSFDWYLPEWDAEKSLYYVQGMLRDGRFFVLHDVDLAELPTDSLIEIHYTDPVGFLTYTKEDGKQVDTYEWELTQKDEDFDFGTDDPGIIGVPVND